MNTKLKDAQIQTVQQLTKVLHENKRLRSLLAKAPMPRQQPPTKQPMLDFQIEDKNIRLPIKEKLEQNKVAILGVDRKEGTKLSCRDSDSDKGKE